MNNLTSRIPRALSNILENEKSNCGPQLFNDALPDLLMSYGDLCSDQKAYAVTPLSMRRSVAFWSVMTHHYARENEMVDSFIYWLGFSPIDKATKMLVIDEAARLLTKTNLTNDVERDEWLIQYGRIIFPGFHEYRSVMMMSWK